jgi:hypothetical protein
MRACSWWSRASPTDRTWRGRSPGRGARFGTAESAMRPAGWRRSVEQLRTNTCPVLSISTVQLAESTKIFAVDLRTQTCPLRAPPHEHQILHDHRYRAQAPSQLQFLQCDCIACLPRTTGSKKAMILNAPALPGEPLRVGRRGQSYEE